jgi:Mitochondrial K+-H+ exchange-related
MQVFFIPIGPGRYEPYFEPEEAADLPVEEGAGWFARLRRRFSEMLREAEEERHRRHEPTAAEARSRFVRWRRALMRWIVERAAEQRLLWHLRTATEATLHIPDDLAEGEARRLLHDGLTRDGDRHRRWFVVHLLCLVVSGVFFFIPGPNLIGYFFTFTTIGHLLAWRGAANGHHRVAWHVAQSAILNELRQAEAVASPERETRVHAVAQRLGLRHLATFVERLAAPPA